MDSNVKVLKVTKFSNIENKKDTSKVPNNDTHFKVEIKNGTIPPTPPPDYVIDMNGDKNITLSWDNIDVHLPEPGYCFKLSCSKKVITNTHILKNVFLVYGIAKPGEMLAIMGASGAGKTTLLNVLNFRNRGNLKITGQVKVNGQVITSPAALAAISGYVQQNEAFIDSLTVREHLFFQAMLRMDSKCTKSERYTRINEIISELNLKKCNKTIIGNPAKNIKGISGGERRRLAFGSETITDPGLLFCDEPTSGLDSFMALSVVDSMRTLANEGKTIVCTIHQPSSEIFVMFDKLCLLANGHLAFLGSSKDALNFFSNLGFQCPINYNPADFYIQKLAITENNQEECLTRVKKICDGFENSNYKKAIQDDISRINTEYSNGENLNYKYENLSPYKAGCLPQLIWLTWRSFKSTIREVLATRIRIVQTVIIAVIIGLLYLQIKLDQNGVQNVNGVLFLLVASNSISPMYSIINSFPDELPIFMREHKNGMYRVITYYLSKIIVEFPLSLILPIASVAISYWMANLNNQLDRFFICCGVIILVANISAAFGCFISAASSSTTVALAIAGPALIPIMIFSGLFLNNSTVPDYFIWLRYLSWFYYSCELLYVNQWDSVKNITCENIQSRCFLDGEQVLKSFSMKKDNYDIDFIALGCLLVGWRIVTFFVLLLKSYISK